MLKTRRWRRLLVWSGAILTTLVPVAVTGGYFFYRSLRLDTVGEVAFETPMAIPPLAPARVEDGARVFELDLRKGRHDFGRHHNVPTLGINGDHLGPTIRVRRGEQVRMEVTNHLGVTSTLHWHGMHLPAAMDGGPHQPVRAGETWTPEWQIDQPAATLWYHPHPHGETASQVYRGLAGMLIVDDDETPEELPREYGVDDLPVIVQDRKLDDGRLEQGGVATIGTLGDEVYVNGTFGPYVDVVTQRVRLRLLNASNARTYSFALASGREIVQVATDGGLLAEPVALRRLRLSPGERAEIVVEMEPGETDVLRSLTLRVGSNFYEQRANGGDDRLDVLQLRAAPTLRPSPELPDRLADLDDPDEDAVTETREFELRSARINGRKMDPSRIDFATEVDTTERWVVRNVDSQPHNFHVHDVQFRVTSVNGDQPPPELRGRKDTVPVFPGDEVELLVSFADHTDPDTPYMFHCHLLQHEDRGMMGQFVVVAPGEEAGEVSGEHAGHH